MTYLQLRNQDQETLKTGRITLDAKRNLNTLESVILLNEVHIADKRDALAIAKSQITINWNAVFDIDDSIDCLELGLENMKKLKEELFPEDKATVV